MVNNNSYGNDYFAFDVCNLLVDGRAVNDKIVIDVYFKDDNSVAVNISSKLVYFWENDSFDDNN